MIAEYFPFMARIRILRLTESCKNDKNHGSLGQNPSNAQNQHQNNHTMNSKYHINQTGKIVALQKSDFRMNDRCNLVLNIRLPSPYLQFLGRTDTRVSQLTMHDPKHQHPVSKGEM